MVMPRKLSRKCSGIVNMDVSSHKGFWARTVCPTVMRVDNE